MRNRARLLLTIITAAVLLLASTSSADDWNRTTTAIFTQPHAQVATSPQHPHGHDCISAGEISLNSEVKALLMSSADFAFYRIVLPQRGLLDVSVDPGAFDAWSTELLDSSCQPVEGALSDNSLITGKWARITVPRKGMVSLEPSIWTLPPGSYFVRIKPNPVNVFREVFSFRTRFIPHYGHDCETAEPMKLPGTIDGQLLYGLDRELFRVTTTGTGLIRAWTTGPLDSAKAPLLRVFAANCSTEATQQASWEESGVTTNVLAPGTYYISVEPLKPEYLGKFTLHLEFLQTASAESLTHTLLLRHNADVPTMLHGHGERGCRQVQP